MKIRLLFIPLILILSCSRDHNKKLILSEKKMIDILVDMQISETYFIDNIPIRNRSDIKTSPPEYFKFIFEKHHITKLQFDESMKYYQNNLPKFKMLYDSVAKRLEDLNDEAKK